MNDRDTTIAITGGIGSGKSVVSHILTAMGYPVYDCDRNARLLMDGDAEMKSRIAREISSDVIVDGCIDRKLLASIVFNDAAMLSRLNSIVHSAVREHFLEYRRSHRGVVFFETAILTESGFHTLADQVWEVIAPKELRILRVMKRNCMTREEVEARIASQSASPISGFGAEIVTIVNDNVESLLQQVTKLLQIL